MYVCVFEPISFLRVSPPKLSALLLSSTRATCPAHTSLLECHSAVLRTAQLVTARFTCRHAADNGGLLSWHTEHCDMFVLSPWRRRYHVTPKRRNQHIVQHGVDTHWQVFNWRPPGWQAALSGTVCTGAQWHTKRTAGGRADRLVSAAVNLNC